MDDTLDWRRWNDPENWRPNGTPNGTPGQADPPPSAFPPVVINEMLAHSTAPQSDAVELHNPTDAPVDIGGWLLTDDFALPHKFSLPSPSVVPAHGYTVFTEADFNPVPGQPPSFALGADGDDIWLFSADPAGRLTGYVQGFGFGATANGISLGRHTNSVGDVDYVALTDLTLGGVNGPPLVGPVVLSEIMYHPAPTDAANLPASFIELANIASTNVLLFDPAAPGNTWRLQQGIRFEFPPASRCPQATVFWWSGSIPRQTLRPWPLSSISTTSHPASRCMGLGKAGSPTTRT